MQNSETGGTRVWPGTHLNEHLMIIEKEGFVDMIDPLLKIGDALIFDGLLPHCGLENKSKKDRYFFYLSFSSKHDHNTDLTL